MNIPSSLLLLPTVLAALFLSSSEAAGQGAPGKAEAPPKWAELILGSSYVLAEEGMMVSARIPLQLQPDAPAARELHAVLRYLQGPSGAPRNLALDFHVDVAVSETMGPALVAEAPWKDLEPGNYQLLVDLTTARGAQPLNITLQRPLPTLTSMQNVLLWRGWGGERRGESSSSILLHELSGKASVTGLSFAEVRDPASEPRDELKLLAPPGATVPAGRDLRIPVLAAGHFPPGKYTGKIEVRARGIPAAAVVTYEVHVRRHPFWLAVCVSLGLLAGFLARKYLQAKIENDAVSADASQARGELNAAQKEIPDATFRATVELAGKALQEAVDGGDTTVIRSAVVETRRKLTEAQAEFAARLQQIFDRLEAARTTLEKSWLLPPEADAKLQLAREARNAAQSLADGKDAVAAKTQLEKSLEPATTALGEAARMWREAAAVYLAELAQNPPALPKAGADNLATAIQAWRTTYGTTPARSSYSLNDLDTELALTNEGFHSARQIAATVERESEKLSTWLRRQFVPPAAPTLFDAVVDQGLGDAHELAADLREPEPNVRKIASRAAAELTRWEAALHSVASGANFAGVDQLLSQGKWPEAAEAALKLVPPPSAALVPSSVSNAPGAGQAGEKAPVSAGFHFVPTFMMGDTSASRPPALILTGTREERRGFVEARVRHEFLQTILLLLVLMAAAYALYLPQWVGTWPEMIAIFLWAFGIDLTLDKLQPIFAKVVPAGK